MKKTMLFLGMFLILLIPMFVQAEECDTSKITISSITLDEKSINVKELSNPVASGKKVNLDLLMLKVGDYITYNVKVKNDSENDFLLDKNSININADYLDYSLLTEDKIIKSKEEKTVQLKIIYKNEVDDSKFVDGKYIENKNMVLSLANENKRVINPVTKNNWLIIALGIVLVIQVLLYVIHEKNLSKMNLLLIMFGLLIIPAGVYAICHCEINVDSKVEIDKVTIGSFKVDDEGEITTYSFIEGMKWNEWLDSDYNVNDINFLEENVECVRNINNRNLFISEITTESNKVKYTDAIINNNIYVYGCLSEEESLQ